LIIGDFMNVVSDSFDTKSRKNASVILQALAAVGQTQVAHSCNVADSTISRLKDGQIDVLAKVLAACGLKVVDESEITISPTNVAAMETLFKAAVRSTSMAELLKAGA